MSRSSHVLPIFALQIVVYGLGLGSNAEAQDTAQPQNSSGLIVGGNINRDARQEARRALEAQRARLSSNANGLSSIVQSPSVNSPPSQGATLQSSSPQGSTASANENIAAAAVQPLFQTHPGTVGLQATDLSVAGPFGSFGMRSGDNVLSINGWPLQSEAQLLQVLRSMGSSNQPANVVIARGGAQQTITVQPAAIMQAVTALSTNGIVLPGINPGMATTVNGTTIANQFGSSSLNANAAGTGSAHTPNAGVPTAADGVTTTSSSSANSTLGPTGAVTGNAAAPTSPLQPSLTSGITRGP